MGSLDQDKELILGAGPRVEVRRVWHVCIRRRVLDWAFGHGYHLVRGSWKYMEPSGPCGLPGFILSPLWRESVEVFGGREGPGSRGTTLREEVGDRVVRDG